MTDRLASLFESAVSMLPMSEARSLDLFTEITNYDESACDAWIGRIRCGDTDRVTLFRAWYSRRNFGQLSGSVQISMSTLNARIAIGGAVRRYHLPGHLAASDHHGLCRMRGSARQLRRRHGGLRGRPGRGFRAPGGVDEGGCLRRGRTLDRRDRPGQECWEMAGQVFGRRGRCGARGCRGKPGLVHRSRTPTHRGQRLARR